MRGTRCSSTCRRHDPVAELKRRRSRPPASPAIRTAFVVKFRGAELQDESRTLADAGLVPNGALIVLRKRRRPVR